jgi:cytochrome bd ubiquinol oxidase subunit II
MGFVWFWIVAVMIAAYVVLDGFDLGVGILAPFLARGENDRRMLMRSIGPVWDGNEVWLLARSISPFRCSTLHRSADSICR